MQIIKSKNKRIKFRTYFISKQADLLLKEVLSHYNIPIRNSSERILDIEWVNQFERRMKLSYTKESTVKDKKILYSVYISLFECVGPDFLKFNYNEGTTLYELYIENFEVIINGEKVKTSTSLLKELAKNVVAKADKPYNLGNPTFINEDNWYDIMKLIPVRGTKAEKIKLLENCVASAKVKTLLLEIFNKLISKEHEESFDIEDISFDITTEYYGESRYPDYEPYVFIGIKFNFKEYNNCRAYLYFEAYHHSSRKKVDWLYLDDIKLVATSDLVFMPRDEGKVLKDMCRLRDTLNDIMTSGIHTKW